ncbi:MAG: tRNA (guanosine(46)-N7)-methyltransferase TrmB [Verrucomicrobiota bacterium]|nr:tRNA (guanosine(46)-N7)-methyltransferase TrmB [Verrucomicrobiota bacterium]
MRGGRALREEEAAVEFIPDSISTPLDFSLIFQRAAALEIDLGCGDGQFLLARAQEFPARNFLGIERLSGRARSFCRKMARAGLTNARVLRIETSCAVQHLVPAASVTLFHLLFPDPWPKRRHQHRRSFNESLMRALHRALVPDGQLHIATDHVDYFQHIDNLLIGDPFFRRVENIPAFPGTAFEEKFLERGLPIYRLLLEKNSTPD